ncbi:type II and III secretion system protein family protein [Desulfothermus naphthae]
MVKNRIKSILILSLFISNLTYASSVSILTRSAEKIRIYLGKTFLITLDSPVARVCVGDMKIALARAISEKEILIKGRTPGITDLIIWYKGKKSPSLYNLKVEIDPAMLQEVESLIKKLVPESHVQLIPAGSELLLEGYVTSVEDMHRVIQIVGAYFKKEEKKKETEEEKTGKSSTTINISTGKGSTVGTGGEGGQLGENVEFTVAIKNNLIILKGYFQVQLDVKIAEVSRSGIKEMGLNFLNNSKWWTIGISNIGGASADLDTDKAFAQSTDSSASYSMGSSVTGKFSIASPFGDAINVLVHSLKGNSLAILSLLKGQGLARLLASPTLITMSGQEATFTVGGEIPVPVTDKDGSTTIQYKEYGIILRFTPYVIRKDTITLDVEPEVSGPDWGLGTSSGGVAVPGITSRKVKTTLQLKDGQTFVIAGLLKEKSHISTRKVPLLGDVPFLGTLFTQKQFSREETELVVVVTPHLVRPLNKGEVVGLPGDLISQDINDLAFFLANAIEFNPPKYLGQIGFSR